MATQRQKGIILKAKASADSLQLLTLLENGDFGAFTIPGVLKSLKRSAFHFSPGAVYDFIWAATSASRATPKSAELVFSPFAENQEYRRLAAVAELVQITDFVRPGPGNTDLFLMMYQALRELPQDQKDIDGHLDRFYWNFLEFLGLAAAPDGDIVEAVAYDLTSGYLTARELSARPAGDFVLPYPWGGVEARKVIRQFLVGI